MGRRGLALVVLLLAVTPATARAGYEVGAAQRSLSPTQAEIDSGEVFLGGYGVTGNPALNDRHATGVLGEGPSVRAFVVGDGRGGAVAMADMEVQGWFAATRDGPYGIVDMRREVERRTDGGLRAGEVFIQSDHTHSGADTMGVWGGVPLGFRVRVFDRTVDAIVAAWETREPAAKLVYGTADGAGLLTNQFAADPDNQAMDTEVRVLQARGADGEVIATLTNFSAHTTVLGASNRKLSGDWVQRLNPMVEQLTGGESVTTVGTLGRSQPRREDCPPATPPRTAEAEDLCELDRYAGQIAAKVVDALAAAKPLPAGAVVRARSYLIADVGANPVLLGLLYAGGAVDAPLNRAVTPPWITGNVIGTVTGSARIGDVLVSSFPGEAYAQIPQAIRDAVGERARGFMTLGLSQDQLGYLIAPFPDAFGQPICATLLEGCEYPLPTGVGQANDNFTFNVSPTMGERVICSGLRGAEEVLGLTGLRAARDKCGLFANDAATPAGADVGGAPRPDAQPGPPAVRSARCARAGARKVVCRVFLDRRVRARVQAQLVRGGRIRARGVKRVDGRHLRIALRGRPGRTLVLRVRGERLTARVGRR